MTGGRFDDSTRFIIASTDPAWFAFLRERGSREVNFWRPSAGAMRAARGTPWFYALRGTQAIVGCAFFAAYSVMPLRMSWEMFGDANGVASYGDFVRVIGALRGEAASGITEIGCAALTDPIYFTDPVPYRRMYGPLASGDTRKPEDARLWDALTVRMSASLGPFSALQLPSGQGAPTLVPPRLGQSAFRTAILSAYERRCAITGERTVPVLEAAHIRPFADLQAHDVRNGLLLRSDLHALFDAGLVTVTPDYAIRVSSQIRERYENGRDYYALEGRTMRLPQHEDDRPLREHLDYHAAAIFQP